MSQMWRARGASAPRRLLACLDLQRASLGPRGEAGPDRCVVNCRRVLAHAREAGWGVVHVHTRRACPDEGRPIEGLEPLTSEPVVYRAGISAFSSAAFRALAEGAELVIIGYSCLATALIAYDEDMAVTLVEDAVSAALFDSSTREALEAVTRQVARPFVALTDTRTLLGDAPRLRLVTR